MVKDIYIDDIGLKSDLGIRARETSEYMSIPELRSYVQAIPGMHGAHFVDSDLEPRPFALDCRILDNSHENMQRKARDLAALLFDQFGKPKEIRLVFGHESEKWYKARYEGYIPIQKRAISANFTLPLIAYDPYAYAPMTYYDPDFVARYDAGTYYDDGITEYTNQTHTPFVNSRQYAGVFNYSHYATPFSFVIEGYVKNPKITNQTTGKSAELDVTVEADERLYFDSNLKTTWKINTKADRWYWLTPNQMMKQYSEWEKINQYNALSGDFIYLASGDNSLLFEGGSPNAQINFNWLHRFL